MSNATTKAQEEGQCYPPGDPLDRAYTPLSLARAVVAALPDVQPTTILDPSVGSGVLLRAAEERWPGARLMALDVDPDAAGLQRYGSPWEVADWPTYARFWSRLHMAKSCEPDRLRQHGMGDIGCPDLIIMNPPFSDVEVAKAHVLAATRLSDHVVAILPLAFLCGSKFAPVLAERRPTRMHRVLHRPWPDRLREAMVLEWRGWRGPPGGTTVEDLAWSGLTPEDGLG